MGSVMSPEQPRNTAYRREPIDLTRAEFDRLAALASRRGSAVSRGWLFEHVMGLESEGTERTLAVHISRVRRKLGPAGARIATVGGVGCRLGDEA